VGDRHYLLLRELREPQRGAPERPLGTRRRPPDAPHRPPDRRRPARGRGRGLQATLPGPAGPLRPSGPGHRSRQGQRERRRRAEAPPPQARPGPGPVAARQPRLRRPRRLRRLPQGVVRPARLRPAGPPGPGAGRVAASAGQPAGGVQAAAGPGGGRQHRPGGRQRLLGAQPADRRVAGGPAVRRAGRTLLRPEARRGGAPAARAGQAPHRLPACDRLAGAQAGGLCRLPLPGRPVPLQPLPHRLRPAVATAAGPGGQGVPADPEAGGARGRGCGGGGVGCLAGGGRPAGGGRRAGAVGQAGASAAGE
jgi:hypothetical protein